MLRLPVDDPLVQSLFTQAELKGMRKVSRIKRGKRAGKVTEEQSLEFQLEEAHFTDFVRQYPLQTDLLTVKTRKPRVFAFDFAWPKLKLLIEVDGGIWRRGGGAHSHPLDILRNMDKSNQAALAGWTILRFTTDHVRKREVIPFVQKFFDSRGWPRWVKSPIESSTDTSDL